MNLHEHQAKKLFARYGVPVAEGLVANSPEEARVAAERLGGRVVVKAQVLTGGRGKAGGVALAADPEEAQAHAGRILGMDLRGHRVRKVLVDPVADIAEELYLGIVLDRSRRVPIVIASRAGGIDIEEVAATRPGDIARAAVDPLLGIWPWAARRLAFGIGLPVERHAAFTRVVTSLFDAFVALDATLAEINPLAILADGKLLALDAKLSVDDSALFRQPRLTRLRDPHAYTGAERLARRAGVNYIDLDGTIACMVNGAGLAMATMDVISFYGGRPANFLDIGGGAQADQVATALRILLLDKGVRSVLINIFGGITRGDEVAAGILEALGEVRPTVPMVARLAGTNAEAGRAMLAEARMQTAGTLTEAAQMAIRAAGEEVLA